ncbi:putative muscarinic acetylcholine receptor gar-2 [Caerostris extrusa]|uniref:Muscarinic acetylcholine receptor gar-2 n=1 Tax=Caerostris extrusa TaxID=172846 RepID=A0AAV4MFP5_CAEEX|nr:putative muscarinic acetylcholine receptor gar-2 [Caerostris extrusa]
MTKEKPFMSLILPTPNLLDTSTTSKALLHYSPNSELTASEATESRPPHIDITSPKGESNDSLPKMERPSVLNISAVQFIDHENCQEIEKNSVCRNTRKEDSCHRKHKPRQSVSKSQSTTFKDVIIECKSGENVTRVAEPSDMLSVTEAVGGRPEDTKTEESRQTLVTALSQRLHRKKRKRSRRSDKRHKSKSENRARKALRTISFILGAFVLCWTPYHICALVAGFCRDATGCVNHHLFYFYIFSFSVMPTAQLIHFAMLWLINNSKKLLLAY